MVVSSANGNTFPFKAFDKSFIYNKNSNGPNMLPWGTPYVISSVLDSVLSYKTYCFLSVK